MKLMRCGETGHEVPAMLAPDDTIRSLEGVVEDIQGDVLSPAGLRQLQQLTWEELPELEKNIRRGACVAGISKFICVGLNYRDHAAETGAEIPSEPVIFNKWISAVCGPDDDILIPPDSVSTDWEVELGVVIGQKSRYLTQERAETAIAGYCLVNDISEREYQNHRGGTWDKGKGFDSFGPVGPWLVTRDEIRDPGELSLWLEVDGYRWQNSNTREMIFDIPTLVTYISQFMTLMPGDIIATGTPAGVGLGLNPPVFLRPGQCVVLGAEGLGEQTHRTVSTPRHAGT
ncbi:fumarylacetoacetate hydrolase family protein [Salmonella enterica]|nr:fumarylacetoacetate hydrolase family protein [Salmonella enterica]EEO3478533.1 fumarylacetoacetate hydrolase family protein [Salmonella enterica subsp. enterica serovar Hvittingfoss]EKR1801881.1 fumarylacetoacetate hydrolase family protein [Salmonella enterica subsp. enterica serovar Dublin]HAF4830194.1 fumarylacetoacetate hydrolase family protein [Salmonella enterica]